VLGIGDELLRIELVSLGEVAFSLRQLILAQDGGGLRCDERGFLLINLGLVEVRFDAGQNVTLLHHVALLDGDVDEFAGHLGRDTNLNLGLNLAGGSDNLRDGFDDRLVGGHGGELLPTPLHLGADHGEDHNGENAADNEPKLHFAFALARLGVGHGLGSLRHVLLGCLKRLREQRHDVADRRWMRW